VAGGTDGEVFGDPLDQTQNDGLPELELHGGRESSGGRARVRPAGRWKSRAGTGNGAGAWSPGVPVRGARGSVGGYPVRP
jgi:hypothetical protein